MNEEEAIQIIRDIMLGMQEIVSKNICHRDLKPENILIHNKTYKVADFGFSCLNLNN